MKNLKEMKSTEIKQLAKSYGIKDWWTKKKDQLIAEIEELQAAGDQAMELLKEEDEREKAAVNEYTKNWKKYTKRYNVGEFLKGWRSGEIVLESEIEKDIEAEEKEHSDYMDSIGQTELPDGEPTEPRSEDISDAEHRNNQDEQENATENESEAPEHAPTKPKRGALIEFNGKSQNICAWAKELGVSANTLYGRLYKLGWSVEKAFTKK